MALCHEAAAVVLAGGRSTRMRRDKRFLSFQGRPLVQHVCEQLRPHFGSTMIVADEAHALDFCGLPVITDRMPGLGPIGGIVSALDASDHDVCFVVPCDMPHIDLALAERVLAALNGGDCVVPVFSDHKYEPLFAAYHKRILPIIEKAIARGTRKIMSALTECNLVLLDMGNAPGFANLNTISDYLNCLYGNVVSES